MIVRSFTSSFDEHVPDAPRILHAPWVHTWLLGSLLFLLFFCGWEGIWRMRGFTPSLIDDASLWASARRSVGPNSIVLVGASKTLLGINPEVFAQTSGVRPLQLAIDGSQATPVLKNLAEDDSFRGIVLFDLMESEIDGTTPPGKEERYLQKYRQQNISDRTEQWLRHRLQANFVFMKPEISPAHVWEGLRSGHLPAPFYLQMQPDRYARADYSMIDPGSLHRGGNNSSGQKLPPGLSVEEFLRRTALLEEYVTRIQERGGRVIFIRMPSSGILWEAQEARYPKSTYWDAFAARTKAMTIHFKDYPELSQYELPDTTHLDYRQAETFTRDLARILMTKGVTPKKG
jgi:hypothetical protein